MYRAGRQTAISKPETKQRKKLGRRPSKNETHGTGWGSPVLSECYVSTQPLRGGVTARNLTGSGLSCIL